MKPSCSNLKDAGSNPGLVFKFQKMSILSPSAMKVVSDKNHGNQAKLISTTANFRENTDFPRIPQDKHCQGIVGKCRKSRFNYPQCGYIIARYFKNAICTNHLLSHTSSSLGIFVYTPVTPNSFLLRPSEQAHIVCELPECSTNYLNVVQTT